MELGVFHSLQAPPEFGATPGRVYGEALDQIVRAEELGFSQAWLTEHHFMDDGYCPSPMIAAAAIAGRTSRIRIGQAIVLLPLYGHPLRLAEDAAVLDVLSGGRLELGIGMGYRAEEFAGFGLELRSRRRRMDEGIAIVRRAWTGERFSYEGMHYQVRDARLRPRPLQRPHPPLWLGAGTPQARAKVARMGLPLLISLITTVEETRREFADYTDALVEAGRDPSAYPRALIREYYVADDAERAWAEVRPYLGYVYREVYPPRWLRLVADDGAGGTRRVTDPNDPYLRSAAFARDRFIVGDPEHCARELARYRDEVGVERLILRMQYPGQPAAQVERCLELTAAEVVPRLGRAAPRA